jgi:hypothetical protein
MDCSSMPLAAVRPASTVMEDNALTVNYQIDIDDPGEARRRTFTLRASWPWAFPPRAGDYIAPHPDLFLAAPVQRVIFRPGSGLIQVLFRADGLSGDASEQIEVLLQVGFKEASPFDS